jgi:hypothetical protein
LPEATWVLGNGYDQALIQSLGKFDQFMSNPPFGRVRTVNGNGKWLVTYAQGADVMAVEIGARLVGSGVMIIPHGKTDYDRTRGEYLPEKSISRHLKSLFPDFNISPWSDDSEIMDEDGNRVKWNGAAPKVEVVDFSISE